MKSFGTFRFPTYSQVIAFADFWSSRRDRHLLVAPCFCWLFTNVRDLSSSVLFAYVVLLPPPPLMLSPFRLNRQFTGVVLSKAPRTSVQPLRQCSTSRQLAARKLELIF